jgi:D-alanyl-D-alanine dipeptidase
MKNKLASLSPPPANAYGLSVVTNYAYYAQQVAANAENELVNLREFIPGLGLDIRYATPDNVLGEALYATASAYLRRPVAEALRQVQQALRPQNLGLLVFDAYRPYRVTVRFYEQIQDENYAAPPWRGSRHNRGCSVDVALINLGSGHPLPMPTAFDALTPAAHASYADLPAAILQNRATLFAAMTQCGFVNYPGEWWHFDHQRWSEFDLLDLAFEELGARQNDL